MSKINWKLRLQNKTTLTALVVLSLSFIYSVLGLFGIVPSVSESEVKDVLMIGIQLLAGLGIIVDPTTKGVTDSSNALEYDCPREG